MKAEIAILINVESIKKVVASSGLKRHEIKTNSKQSLTNFFFTMGSYANNNLIKDENVQYEATYHWIIFCNLRALLTLFIAPLIDLWTDEFVITNRRIIIKTGLIARKTVEMNLSKIETVNVDQSILGRILGYGTITIVGTGGTREWFPNIKSPLKFRRTFQELCD